MKKLALFFTFLFCGLSVFAQFRPTRFDTNNDVDATAAVTGLVGAQVASSNYVSGANLTSSNYATTAALGSYVLSSTLAGSIGSQVASSNYVSGANLTSSNYATTAALNAYIPNSILSGSAGNQFQVTNDAARIATLPVVLFRPTAPTSAMVVDVMPSADSYTNTIAAFHSLIDLVNRNLDAVADNTNFTVARIGIRTNLVVIGSSAGGTSDAFPLALQATTNSTQPFAFVWVGQGGKSYSTNAYFNGTGGFWAAGGIIGTTAGDNAAAGSVGEYTNRLLAFGSAQALQTGISTNVLSITLAAGDWNVWGCADTDWTSATVTKQRAAISTTSATLPADGSAAFSGLQLTTTTTSDSIPLQAQRVVSSGSTTVYLVVQHTFSAGTGAAYGQISARRVR